MLINSNPFFSFRILCDIMANHFTISMINDLMYSIWRQSSVICNNQNSCHLILCIINGHYNVLYFQKLISRIIKNITLL